MPSNSPNSFPRSSECDKTILGFGGSGPGGWGASFKRGWLQGLRERFHTELGSEKSVFHELAAAGEDAATFRTRVAYVTSANSLLIHPARPVLSIVALGLNEPSANTNAGRNPGDLLYFTRPFTDGIRMLMKHGDVLICGAAAG